MDFKLASFLLILYTFDIIFWNTSIHTGTWAEFFLGVGLIKTKFYNKNLHKIRKKKFLIKLRFFFLGST